MRKLKKGFTLVELLVVLAILAILASVSVVGYLKFTDKANLSNDTSMITQMNHLLQASEASEGKNTTAYDAFCDLEKSNVIIDDLTPYSTGYKYAWDKATDRMVLLDDNKNVVVGDADSYEAINLFVPVDSSDELTNYTTSSVSAVANTTSTKLSTVKLDSNVNGSSFSIYLTTNYSDTLLEITANISVDLGKNTTVTTVTYSATVSNDVYVRTNGGDLTISSESGTSTLSVLGSSSTTTVSSSVKVSVESEITKQLEITSTTPSIIVTESSSVRTLVFSTSSKVSTSNIKVESSTDIEVIVTEESGVTDTVITGISTKVDTADEGLIEASALFEGGYGTEANPYLISTEEQLLEFDYNSKSTSNYQKYFIGKQIYIKFVNDIVGSSSKNYPLNIDNIDLTIDLAGNSLEVTFGAALFSIGSNPSSDYNTKLTLNDSVGTGKIIGYTKNKANIAAIFRQYSKKENSMELVINGGNYYVYCISTNSDPTCILYMSGQANKNVECNATINGGYFYNGVEQSTPILLLAEASCSAILNIYGGTFDTLTKGYYVINIQDDAAGTNNINLYGGYYVGYNPTSSSDENIVVADGYEVIESSTDSDGIITYEVIKKSS